MESGNSPSGTHCSSVYTNKSEIHNHKLEHWVNPWNKV